MKEGIHNPGLPAGWYPRSRSQIRSFLEKLDGAAYSPGGCACIVPHAGWSFSGKTAARAISAMASCDVLVLVGGHLGPGDTIWLLPYSAYNTPAGFIETHRALADSIESRFDIRHSSETDNTTEVQLPLIAYYHPDTPIVVLRAPPSGLASELGCMLAEYEREESVKIGMIGSTDLTHYGPGYGFTPMGTAAEAYAWIRDVNDHRFIQAAMKGDVQQILRLGLAEHSACSPGAAASAVSFAFSSGCRRSELLEYSTSYDMMPSENLVGYAALLYSPA
jgi:hypothetical protein